MNSEETAEWHTQLEQIFVLLFSITLNVSLIGVRTYNPTHDSAHLLPLSYFESQPVYEQIISLS